jgi:putative acetyltransferase
MRGRAYVVRRERPEDRIAIREVNERAFGRGNEADLVDALRRDAQPFVSLVATVEGKVVGHIAFSPVAIEGAERLEGMALAPMAVLPELQNRGIGSRLVRAGLKECRAPGRDVVVVLGHPAYYPRFGFVPGREKGLRCEHGVPDEVFVVLELAPGGLRRRTGLVRDHAAFARV